MQIQSTAAPSDALTGTNGAAVIAAASKPKKAGRERSCHQCGTAYRSIRSTSLYCTTPCRKKAKRGTASTGGPKSGPDSWGPISKALLIAGYVGRTGPLSPRSTQPNTYALLVDTETAHAELAHQFNRRGWGMVSREEFAGALKADGVRGFSTRSPAAVAEKRKDDRNRQWRTRAS